MSPLISLSKESRRNSPAEVSRVIPLVSIQNVNYFTVFFSFIIMAISSFQSLLATVDQNFLILVVHECVGFMILVSIVCNQGNPFSFEGTMRVEGRRMDCINNELPFSHQRLPMNYPNHFISSSRHHR